MTSDEALKQIKALAKARRYFIRDHAWELRMAQRRLSTRDILHCIEVSVDCRPSSEGPGRWEVRGTDCDEEPMLVVCVIDDILVVLTVA